MQSLNVVRGKLTDFRSSERQRKLKVMSAAVELGSVKLAWSDAAGLAAARLAAALGSERDRVAAAPRTRERAEAKFAELAPRWRAETMFQSSGSKVVYHPLYLQIIGLGEPIVPRLLKEMQDGTGLWSSALEAITGENPVPPEVAGNIRAIAAHWVEWGRTRRLID